MKKQIKKSTYEFYRLFPLIFIVLLSCFWLYDITQIKITIVSLSMLSLGIILFHFLRKTLFSYLDFSIYFEKAKENSVASAIVIFSMILFLCIVLLCLTLLVQ